MGRARGGRELEDAGHGGRGQRRASVAMITTKELWDDATRFADDVADSEHAGHEDGVAAARGRGDRVAAGA